MARVFVSHAGDDRALAGTLHRWLVEAGHELFLAQDLRDGTAVGEQWKQRLHERLRWADAVVCVVTSKYLASRWCAAEVATAVSRGSRLLPVHAEPRVTDPLLEGLQYTDMVQDPGAARGRLVEALRRVDAAGGSGWPDDRCAFPGLRSFDVAEHRVFFGRGGEVARLAELLRSPAEGMALLVVGPSGCGKSSLVRAGLVPVMAGESEWWTLAPMVPGADPVAALVRELAGAARRVGLDWTVTQVRHDLDEAGLAHVADELLLTALGGRRGRLLIVVDQFEELLTQSPPSARARFTGLLRPALADPVQMVATLRPEFLNQLLVEPELAALPMHTVTLRPLHRDALRAVIEGPAELAGIGVDDELVARLVADTDTGEALPLLAFTLAQLAEGVGLGGQLSAARYEQLGGVRGALTRQADAALADAITAGGRDRDEVIAGLLTLVSVDEQGRPTRWRVPRGELSDPVAAEWGAFIARRLLITDTDDGNNGDGTVVVGVAHEAFLSAWPPLSEAITAAGSALRARRAIEHAASEWNQSGRVPGRLWERGQLTAALADTGARTHAVARSRAAAPADASSAPHTRRLSRWWPRRHRVLVTDRIELSADAHAFLHAGIRRDRRRRGRATTILSTLLTLALVAAGLALIQRHSAQEQQRVATARQLLAQAELARDVDPRTALLLGIGAQGINPTGESRASLVTTLTTTRYAGTLTGHSDGVGSVAFSPVEQTLATAGSDNTVILWDLTDPTRPTRRSPPLTGTSSASQVRFSPDGRTLATTSSDDKTVILWDLTDPTRPTRHGSPLTGHTDFVNSVAFSPDGHTLATASYDNATILWDLTDPTRPTRRDPPLTGHTSSVNSVAFSPDGHTLATAYSLDETITLWDLTDPTQPTRRGPPLTGSVNSVAFSPDGHTLATASYDNATILWDLTDPTRPTRRDPPLTGHTSSVNSVAFSPDGHTLATASDDNTAILWDLTDPTGPTRRGQPLTGHTSPISELAFSFDGHILATSSYDNTAILWDLTDPTRPTRRSPPLTDHTSSVNAVAFSPDGHTLATVSSGDKSDETVILWDLTDPSRPTRRSSILTGRTGYVGSVALFPDGHTLVTASADNTVILWDLTDPTRPTRRGSSLPGSLAALSPDGRTLATGSTVDKEKTVLLWDLTDPTRPTRRGSPLTGNTAGAWPVALSPDGRTLVTFEDDGANRTVILWDFIDPSRPTHRGLSPTDYTRAVNSVALSPDGRTLATATLDKTVILWDLTDPTRPTRRGPPLTGHTAAMFSVAFSPDGHTLATASIDETVILWDFTDPTRPTRRGPPLTGHTGYVNELAFSPDGRTLATASADSTVILWDLTELNYLRDHATERACAITGRGLDRDEWARYIPGLAYQNTCPI